MNRKKLEYLNYKFRSIFKTINYSWLNFMRSCCKIKKKDNNIVDWSSNYL